jgi:hypothetical protein
LLVAASRSEREVHWFDSNLRCWTWFLNPWGSRWWLGLTVNQFAAGSIPAYGAVAVLYWFQELRCERSQCRFNSDRSPYGRLQTSDFRYQASVFPEDWSLIPETWFIVLWSNGNDSCLTNRERWFDSIQDYSPIMVCRHQIKPLSSLDISSLQRRSNQSYSIIRNRNDPLFIQGTYRLLELLFAHPKQIKNLSRIRLVMKRRKAVMIA